MTVLSVALHLLGLVGATIIFTSGTIFARVRRVWPNFLGCPLCVGFWVGAADAVRTHGLAPVTGDDAVGVIVSGSLVGLVALMVEAWLVTKLGEKEGD